MAFAKKSWRSSGTSYDGKKTRKGNFKKAAGRHQRKQCPGGNVGKLLEPRGKKGPGKNTNLGGSNRKGASELVLTEGGKKATKK